VASCIYSSSTVDIAGELHRGTTMHTVLMGVVVSGTHSKSTTEIAGDLHRGAAQLYPLCLLLHKLPHCFDGRGG